MLEPIQDLIDYLKAENPFFGELIYFLDKKKDGEYCGITDVLPRQMYVRLISDEGEQFRFDYNEPLTGCDAWQELSIYLVVASQDCLDDNKLGQLIYGQISNSKWSKIISASFDAEEIYKDENKDDESNEYRCEYGTLARFKVDIRCPYFNTVCGSTEICKETCC